MNRQKIITLLLITKIINIINGLRGMVMWKIWNDYLLITSFFIIKNNILSELVIKVITFFIQYFFMKIFFLHFKKKEGEKK